MGGCFTGFTETEDLNELERALQRLEMCCTKAASSYFHEHSQIIFKTEHTVQYTVFLYFFANELYKFNKVEKASYVYYLNKVMNSVDWFYAVELPDYFFAEHPIGSVLGRASYGNYFWVYQGTTVGGNRTNGAICYPVIGEYVTMFSNSKIIGNSHIGNHVVFAANTYIKDMDVPDYSIVFGQYPNIVVKPVDEEKMHEITKNLWILENGRE